MKLLYFGSSSHHKNSLSIVRMCNSLKIDFEETNDRQRLSRNDYDIVIFFSYYVDPLEAKIPDNVKIIYGPQHWIFPSGRLVGNSDPVLSSRCVYNTLSKWVETAFIELVGSMAIPLVQFPFGVDTDKFKPEITDKTLDCIVYIKRRDTNLVKNVLDMLGDLKLTCKIFRYGSYQEAEYLKALRNSKFMITLDAHESQGFALQEAMSCNVPLLVIDAQSMYDEMPDGVNSEYKYLKPKEMLSTSVPYWSNKCGIKISSFQEFPTALNAMILNWNYFTPREYIIETLSDDVCMKRILEYFNL